MLVCIYEGEKRTKERKRLEKTQEGKEEGSW